MSAVGIIAEFDPLHRGHAHLIQTVRERFPGVPVAVALGGSFTQRGEAACFSRFDRAALALEAGADLAALLPVSFACASAERFARGGVAVLRELGCDTLAFGSESGDLAALQEAADALDSPAYPALLREELSAGSSFAAARAAAVERLTGSAAALSQPNDLLGVEYLRALRGTGIQTLLIRRVGEGHDSPDTASPFASASAVRALLRAGETERALACLPEEAVHLVREALAAGRAPADLRHADRAILAVLRQSTAEDFAALPDVSEGLEHRLARAARECRSPEDFCARVKTKRYAYARLRRILLRRWLGLTREDCPDTPTFLQLLGMSGAGQALLHARKDALTLPLVTRPADGKRLTGQAGRDFALECRADDLWGLCTPEPLEGGWSLKERVRRAE